MNCNLFKIKSKQKNIQKDGRQRRSVQDSEIPFQLYLVTTKKLPLLKKLVNSHLIDSIAETPKRILSLVNLIFDKTKVARFASRSFDNEFKLEKNKKYREQPIAQCQEV